MAAGNRILITGASGLLGREIVKTFKANDWNILGLAYSRVTDELMKVDIKNATDVQRVFNDFKPHVVVHSAAERRPDRMEGDLAGSRALNVSSTELITKLCEENHCFLIYMSTDYVFDGESPPYKPNDKTNPLNAYGVSKRDGELAVQSYTHSAILRVPVLYGNIESIDESAVTIIYNVVKSGKPTKLSDYEVRFPTHTIDVSKAILQIASKSLHDKEASRGIWHFSANNSYTKYSMACVMARILQLDISHIEAVKGPSGGAPRPYNTQLESSDTFKAFDGCQPSLLFEDVIHQILKPFLSA